MMKYMRNEIDINQAIHQSYFIDQWKEEQKSALRLKYKNRLNEKKLDAALNKLIEKRLYVPTALLENNYLQKTAQTDLLQIIDFIHTNNPIIGGNGVLYYQHKQKENPMLDWIISIMDGRKLAKKMRAKFPKGTAEWLSYEMRQLMLKIIINSLYGGFGYRGFIFANIFLSTSVTMLGQNTISSAAMGFEAFLANNAVFVEENEVLRFIDFTVQEADGRLQMDQNLFDPFDTPIDEILVKKILNSCKFKISREFHQTLLDIISNMEDHQKILLYYKNNLYEFCSTPIMHQALIKLHTIVDTLLVPDVSKLSDEASSLVEFIWNMFYAFVVFDHPVYDKIRKNKYTYKKAVAYQDTDSNFLVLGPWVNYIKSIIPDQVPIDKEALQNFDFKIVNLMTIFVTRVVACSFACLCNSMNVDEEHTKKLAMKNEFYFTRILFTSKKKRYVARPMLQEGVIIPEGQDHEYKGLVI